MRLVVGLFAMFLTASIARADEAKAPEAKLETSRVKVPLRLVKILADSRQVLLFDKNKGSHVLAEVGQTIDGYTVDDIDEDEVTLVTTSGKEIVLTLPAPAVEAPAKKPTRAPAKAVLVPADPYAAPAAEAPVDPYAEPAVRSVAAPSALPAILPPLGAEGPIVDPNAAPADPYAAAAAAAATRSAATFVPPADAAPVRELGSDPNSTDAAPADPYATKTAPSFAPPAAPADPYATAPAPKKAAKPVKGAADVGAFLPPGTSATDAKPAPAVAPPAIAPTIPAVDDPYAADDEPAPAPKARPVVVAPPAPALDPDAPPAPVITPTVLSRSELNVALGDFNKLSSMLRGSFTKDGARLDSVAPNSVFAKAGLRAGDVVTAVDNAPIRSIDDAAELYVRAPQTRAANIQLLRGGKPMTLRVLMQ
jgi:type II secretory pathway component PulC